jgi:hypothetical protein
MYARLDMADAWAIIGPINWYAPSSNLKLMFDRMVCMNGGNPDEKLIAHKDPELAMALEHTDKWKEISLNHLEGRTAAFFCYGDDGGNEIDETGRPKILKHTGYFNPDDEPFENDRLAYQALVWQCRYGGVEVPDHLWKYELFGKNKEYGDTQSEDMVKDEKVMHSFDNWTNDFAGFVQHKGKVVPGRYRAYGYMPPFVPIQELKTGIRSWKLRFGRSPKYSSPWIQMKEGLNKDVTWNPAKGEGKKLREK